MIKKFTLLNNSFQIENILDFYKILAEMKALFRQGWLNAQIDKNICESVAEHSFSMALTAIYLLPLFPELNNEKAIKMCLIHDLAEAYIGDFTPIDGLNHKEKFNLEYNAINQIFAKFPKGNELLTLWNEFENASSPEGEFVRDIDKLDMLLQSLVYEVITDTALSDFQKSALESIKNKQISKIAFDLIISK